MVPFMEQIDNVTIIAEKKKQNYFNPSRFEWVTNCEMFSYEYYIPLPDADTVIYRFPTQLGLRSLALILHPFFSTAKHTSRVFVLHSSSHKITKYRDPIGASTPSPKDRRHYIIVLSFGLDLCVFYLSYTKLQPSLVFSLSFQYLFCL